MLEAKAKGIRTAQSTHTCNNCGKAIHVTKQKRVHKKHFCNMRCRGEFARSKGEIERRFWSFVNKTETCWLWMGPSANCGYGDFRTPDLRIRAHRFSYELFNGPIADGLFLCHSCDNPRCVNPSHMFVGTPKDNTQDMLQKGRCKPPRGTRQWKSKLTETDIVKIRGLLADGLSRYRIARMYDVADQTIDKIANGRTWRHVLTDVHSASSIQGPELPASATSC